MGHHPHPPPTRSPVPTTRQQPARPARPVAPTRPTRPSGPARPDSVEAVALLRLAQAGDRDAFGQLYAIYARNVRRYVAARMRDRYRDTVADLVQDTFCAALQELDRAHEDVEGWLIQLAAKMCTRHAWSQRRYLRAALTTGEHQLRHATSAPGTEPNHVTRSVVAQALAGLDPPERLTLQLRYLDGHDHQTTARILGCSPWTVKQRQRRALQQLAARLGEIPSTPPHPIRLANQPLPAHTRA
jgi:RNA polymerase sigma-70 factor (ECF subfamily)